MLRLCQSHRDVICTHCTVNLNSGCEFVNTYNINLWF